MSFGNLKTLYNNVDSIFVTKRIIIANTKNIGNTAVIIPVKLTIKEFVLEIFINIFFIIVPLLDCLLRQSFIYLKYKHI